MKIRRNRPLSEVVAEAEAAVAGVKDAELRRVAFEKVLSSLLEQSSASSSASARQRAPAAKTTKGPKGSVARRTGPKGRIEELVDDGFFVKPKTIAEVKAELANRGHHVPLTSLSGPLQKLTQIRRLRRSPLSVRGKTTGTKATYAYSNW